MYSFELIQPDTNPDPKRGDYRLSGWSFETSVSGQRQSGSVGTLLLQNDLVRSAGLWQEVWQPVFTGQTGQSLAGGSGLSALYIALFPITNVLGNLTMLQSDALTGSIGSLASWQAVSMNGPGDTTYGSVMTSGNRNYGFILTSLNYSGLQAQSTSAASLPAPSTVSLVGAALF